MARYNTIKLKKYVDVIIEKEANAAIYPGYVIELMSTDKVRAHATAGGNIIPRMVALEDELQGRGIDDPYAAGDWVQCMICRPGDVVFVFLVDGANVGIGTAVESNGAGMVTQHAADTESFESNEGGAITVYPEQIFGISLDTKDLSDSSGEEESSGALGFDHRIRVLIV